LKGLAERNQDAFFNELYDATHEKVLAYIIAKCGNTEDIADIFQETYTEIVSVIRRKGTAYLKNSEAFVMQIAKRKIYRHYRTSERLKSILEKCGQEEEDSVNMPQEKISLEENLMTKMAVEKAVAYLSRKDELTKKIFYLHYYMDKTIKEIAGLLCLKESNVKNRLYRTQRELQEHLRKEAYADI